MNSPVGACLHATPSDSRWLRSHHEKPNRRTDPFVLNEVRLPLARPTSSDRIDFRLGGSQPDRHQIRSRDCRDIIFGSSVATNAVASRGRFVGFLRFWSGYSAVMPQKHFFESWNLMLGCRPDFLNRWIFQLCWNQRQWLDAFTHLRAAV